MNLRTEQWIARILRRLTEAAGGELRIPIADLPPASDQRHGGIALEVQEAAGVVILTLLPDYIHVEDPVPPETVVDRVEVYMKETQYGTASGANVPSYQQAFYDHAIKAQQEKIERDLSDSLNAALMPLQDEPLRIKQGPAPAEALKENQVTDPAKVPTQPNAGPKSTQPEVANQSGPAPKEQKPSKTSDVTRPAKS